MRDRTSGLFTCADWIVDKVASVIAFCGPAVPQVNYFPSRKEKPPLYSTGGISGRGSLGMQAGFGLQTGRKWSLPPKNAEKWMHFFTNQQHAIDICENAIEEGVCHHSLWQKYNNYLSKQYWWQKVFWSDGYFACSIGEVSSATIQKYIESQG